MLNQGCFTGTGASRDDNSFGFQSLQFCTKLVTIKDLRYLCQKNLLFSMTEEEKTKDFYDRLREQLENDTTWPTDYLFKFIVPASLEKIAEIEAVFDNMNAVMQTRDSSKGTYTSISVKVNLESPDAVIEKYLQVSKVEGVISL